MARQRSKIATLLFTTVYIGFLCLCQVTCSPSISTNTQEPEIDPDKFALCIEDKSTNKNNFVAVRITPGSPGMNVEEFRVTASVAADQGTVKGATNKKGGEGLDYTKDLSGCSIPALSHNILKAKQDGQGPPITFRVQVIPGATIKKGDRYTLTVTVERKGDNAHTETQSIVLTAKQDGVDTQEKTEEGSASGTNSKTSTTTLGTVPDNAPQPIHHPTPSEDLPIPTKKVNTINKNSPVLVVSDTDLPATPNGEIPNTSSAQITDPSNSATAEPSDNASTSAQQPAYNQFTVTLKDETRSMYTKNFVLVTIKPGRSGMKLKKFAVTAHLETDSVAVNGSSGRNSSSFVYGKKLNNCNLEALFLTNNQSNCLGKNDTSFEQGREVAFRIEVAPGATFGPGGQYTLTVKVEYTGSNPHIEVRTETLTAPKGSPVKEPKHSPRKRK